MWRQTLVLTISTLVRPQPLLVLLIPYSPGILLLDAVWRKIVRMWLNGP